MFARVVWLSQALSIVPKWEWKRPVETSSRAAKSGAGASFLGRRFRAGGLGRVVLGSALVHGRVVVLAHALRELVRHVDEKVRRDALVRGPALERRSKVFRFPQVSPIRQRSIVPYARLFRTRSIVDSRLDHSSTPTHSRAKTKPSDRRRRAHDRRLPQHSRVREPARTFSTRTIDRSNALGAGLRRLFRRTLSIVHSSLVNPSRTTLKNLTENPHSMQWLDAAVNVVSWSRELSSLAS